jgi:hypothetical protein
MLWNVAACAGLLFKWPVDVASGCAPRGTVQMTDGTQRILIAALPVLIASCSGAITGGSSDGHTGLWGGPNTGGSGAANGGAANSGGGNGGSGANAGSGATGGMLDPNEDPGRVTLHRLNRVEYANTVRHLLGTTARPSDDFPADDRGYGYDNIADVLSLSPLQLEMYFNAAQVLIDEAMNVTQIGARRFEAEAMTASTGAATGDAWNLNSAGNVQQSVMIETEGQYRIAVRAWQQAGGPDAARMSIQVNGMDVSTVEVTAEESTPQTYEATAMLAAGTTIIGASFLNDFYEAPIDRNLLVDWVEVEGPIGAAAGDNPLRERIMVCEPDPADPETCLREVVTAFGRRAYRRPLDGPEVDALVGLATSAIEAGDDVDQAARLMLRAMLVSPHFVFRVEHDEAPDSLTPHVLSDHELASRLSYFLWSSMPDEELLQLADDGELSDDAVLRAQVQRMLADEKAEALLENFAGQWLFIRQIEDHVPDYDVFPGFDEDLRVAMRAETEAFVRELLFGNVPMNRMLDADFSFINERLATHYGMSGVEGDAVERVSLEGVERRGLLTQASILMVTSYATRTSPVKRGKWVLEQLLCESPPPPPPGVEGLTTEETPTGSLRERMEAHRTDPVCSTCHTMMDPIGFSFEHYDGIGRYRDTDNGFDIDPAGVLPNGTEFEGPLELATLLTGDERLPRCIAKQLLTYALGRGLEPHDKDDLDGMTAAFVAGGYQMPELIAQVVLSEAFRMRRGEVEEAP